jgi:chromosomal replication initiator protein
MKAWEQFLSRLEQELGSEVVNRWLKPIRILRFDAANLHLEAPDPLIASWFEEYIRPRLKRGFFNENFRPVKVYLHIQGAKKEPGPAPGQSAVRLNPDSIDPSLTLSDFSLDPNNEVAWKLIQEWTTTNQCPFNPVFLFGPKGSGKTHLLMGAALELIKAKKKVFYVNADTFTEHVVQAIRKGQMQEFRKVYRDIDVLLVDDVDRLAGRAATQEEFFHTFNTLHTAGKQIVLTSKFPPSKIEEIEPRLISRFEWGVTLKLEKAPSETIIQLKAKLWNLSLTPELFAFLIHRFPSDPVAPLQALALRMNPNEPLTLSVAEKLLADLLRSEAERAITPEKVVKALSTHFGIKPEDLLGKSQTKEIALPRQIAMYICRESLKMPFQAIGKTFQRDHSTVMSSVKQVQKSVQEKEPAILVALSLRF